MINYLELEYPYYNLYYKFDKKQILKYIKNFVPEIYYDKFDKLKNIKMNKFLNSENNNKYFIIEDIYSKTSYINDITDYFSEHIRVKCKFKNYLSPYEYWNKNKKNILQNDSR
jgi:hypothetical protein